MQKEVSKIYQTATMLADQGFKELNPKNSYSKCNLLVVDPEKSTYQFTVNLN